MSSRLRTAVAAFATLALVIGAVGAPVTPARAAGPFSLSTDTLAFGLQDAHGSSTLSVVMTNEDAASHVVLTAAITGATPDFSIDGDTCSGATIAPAATCQVTVRFGPSIEGARVGTLSIPTDGGATTYAVALSGSGVFALNVTGNVAFGDVRLDAAPVTQAATITNLGGYGTLTPSSATIEGLNAADFDIATDGCSGVDLGSSSACEVAIEFTPSAMGPRQAVLVITGPAPIGTLQVALSVDVTGPASPVTWGSTSAAGPNYTWNYGMSLARTVDGSTQRLHLVYNTDRVGGKWVKDSGPYMGVYYVRSTSGRTWTSPKRLNPSKQHAERAAAAASGSSVYAVWVSQKKVDPSATAARVLYVRVNTDHGAASQWKSPIRLSSTTGRVDYPSVAVSGRSAYVTWTDATTGSIKLAVSHDRGASWSTRSVGSTTYRSREGYEGIPFVSASGSNVVVAWSFSVDNGLKVRTSSDKGGTWSAATTLADFSYSTVSVAVRGSRFAAAWTIDQGVLVAVKNGADWAPPVLVAEGEGNTFGPAVLLQDPSRVGVAFSDNNGADSRLRWIESPDNGVAWYQPQDVATPSSSRAFNDWPSVVWPSAGMRIVAWNGWNSTSTYRQFVRTGSGSPAGLPTVAPRLSSLTTSSSVAVEVRHKTR